MLCESLKPELIGIILPLIFSLVVSVHKMDSMRLLDIVL